jgi:Immunity protein 53
MPSDAMPDLAQWYARHCDGEWEHHHGITIATTDNPGWWVKIDLSGTELADRAFAPILQGVDADGFPTQTRWLCCRLQETKWHGAGDETQLAEIIGRFLAWAFGDN